MPDLTHVDGDIIIEGLARHVGGRRSSKSLAVRLTRDEVLALVAFAAELWRDDVAEAVFAGALRTMAQARRDARAAGRCESGAPYCLREMFHDGACAFPLCKVCGREFDFDQHHGDDEGTHQFEPAAAEPLTVVEHEDNAGGGSYFCTRCKLLITRCTCRSGASNGC